MIILRFIELITAIIYDNNFFIKFKIGISNSQLLQLEILDTWPSRDIFWGPRDLSKKVRSTYLSESKSSGNLFNII